MKILCTLQIDSSLIITLISWTVPFLLGLFSSFIIDKLRKNQENKRNKIFIKMYLKDSILDDLPKLESSYEIIKNKINDYSDGPIKIPIFEGFNTNVLNGIEPVDYFEIFKEKYIVLNEIISTIDFLSNNLPIKINRDYYKDINKHLKEIEKTGDLNHIKECDYCNDRKKYIVDILDLRISETRELKNKIQELIK